MKNISICLLALLFATAYSTLLSAQHDHFGLVLFKQQRQWQFVMWTHLKRVDNALYVEDMQTSQRIDATLVHMHGGLYMGNITGLESMQVDSLQVRVAQHYVARVSRGITHVAVLQGSQQMRPIDTTCSGLALFTIVTQPTSQVEFLVRHDCKTATSIAVHGPAHAGEDGAVITVLENTAIEATVRGTLHALSEQTMTDMLEEHLYVNVRSLKHPTGELRGQIAPRLFYSHGECPLYAQKCGTACYDSWISSCYYDSLVCAIHESPCGTQLCYNPVNDTCIDDKHVCKVDHQICGTICYNPTHYTCINDDLVAKSVEYAAQQACGSQVCELGHLCCNQTCYDTESFQCTQEHMICPRGDSLCPTAIGAVCFNPALQACTRQTQSCSYSHDANDCILCKQGQLSCGTMCYDPKMNKCIHGKIHSK